MLYRIHSNIIATDGIKSKLQPPLTPTSTTKKQSAVLAATLQNPVRDQQYSFLPRTIRDWNDLPQEVIEAKTIDTLFCVKGLH